MELFNFEDIQSLVQNLREIKKQYAAVIVNNVIFFEETDDLDIQHKKIETLNKKEAKKLSLKNQYDNSIDELKKILIYDKWTHCINFKIKKEENQFILCQCNRNLDSHSSLSFNLEIISFSLI